MRALLPRGDGCTLAFGGCEGDQHGHGLVARGRKEVAGVEHRGDRGDDCGRELTDSASENLGRGSSLSDPSPWPATSAGEMSRRSRSAVRRPVPRINGAVDLGEVVVDRKSVV